MDERTAAAMKPHLPVPDAESAPFWQGTKEGRFLVRSCLACGRKHFYPRHHCPWCWSSNLEWCAASKYGRVYSYTVVHRSELPPFRDLVPYIVALIDLEDGVRVTSNVVECTPESVHVGLPVEIVFERVSEAIVLPKFRPRT